MAKPILLAFDDVGYAQPWKPVFDVVQPDKSLSMLGNIQRADVVLFTGGADISPRLYGDKTLNLTHCYDSRDNLEEVIFNIAIKLKKGVLGICRGAQLACAMAGGRLVQDVTNHTSSHDMTTSDGEILRTSSLHHQMMLIGTARHELLAWSKKLSKHYLVGEDIRVKNEFPIPVNILSVYADDKEPEVAYFPEIRALAIQGHPEMMDEKNDAKSLEWFRAQAKKYFAN